MCDCGETDQGILTDEDKDLVMRIPQKHGHGQRLSHTHTHKGQHGSHNFIYIKYQLNYIYFGGLMDNYNIKPYFFTQLNNKEFSV